METCLKFNQRAPPLLREKEKVTSLPIWDKESTEVLHRK